MGTHRKTGRLKRHAPGLWTALICILAIAAFVAALYWRSFWLAYEVYAPDTDDPAARPALIVLHGRSGDGAIMRQWLGFDDFAQQYGFIVIYPQSHQDGWDFGVGIRERGMVARRYVDHTQYILDILDEVDESHPVDRSRVFVAGVSDGASMAVHMSCESTGVLAGLISVAATLPVYGVENCDDAGPLSVLMINGLEDTVMPWQGTTYRQYKVYLSVEESIDWWRDRNGCPARAQEAIDYIPLTGEVERLIIDHCKSDTQIVSYRLNDGGHTWPGRDHPLNRTTGRVNRDMDATRVVTEWIVGRMGVLEGMQRP